MKAGVGVDVGAVVGPGDGIGAGFGDSAGVGTGFGDFGVSSGFAEKDQLDSLGYHFLSFSASAASLFVPVHSSDLYRKQQFLL